MVAIKPFLSKVEHTPNYEGTELAEVAIDVYRNNIKPKPEEDPKQAYESNPDSTSCWTDDTTCKLLLDHWLV